MDNLIEVVTITKVEGNSVSYSGSEYFDGCHVTNFPHIPEVGEKWEITSNWGKIKECKFIGK